MRTWFITGANSGFGAAFTQAALAAGDTVIAAVRRPETMQAIAEANPARVTVLPLDLGDPTAREHAIGQALAGHGHIDVLVNNAGFGYVGAIEETPEADLRDVMEVMFFAPLHLTRLALPHMRARRTGTIIQLTSMGGLLAFPGVGAYCAAKGALEQASEALAGEVAPLGIRVLIVEPGAYRTGFAGPGLSTSRQIPDYAATVDPVRQTLADSHGTQPGDPAEAATAVLAALELPDPPLRLPLGEDAVQAIQDKLAAVADDLARTHHLRR
ncbi:SDR family NAD(P)-dependent oxidoreductase [Crossiella cryophila]|uniref:NAD(P)-dependent dehydrogenase (Short-subunit alcohol dehydrogenase family) n=1 Tax=Crossiella cryophila TaxID=43355 RepID=A0A7W7CA54_9PSEU|nr:SDR family NAD(P)-dependent oxidoreductase [Crossiella cryophila]MBB4677353.1 NAD(P)-dependent dehydrogenase (short-subunit alcohol dehydrogenase family) [Crossiella cryophila]